MALSSDFIDRNLFDAGGHTGKTYYVRYVRRHDGYVWDTATQTLVDPTTITWAASVTLLVEDGTTGVFPVVADKNMPAGVYDVVVFEQFGSTPANTDDVTKEWQTKLGGGIFGF